MKEQDNIFFKVMVKAIWLFQFLSSFQNFEMSDFLTDSIPINFSVIDNQEKLASTAYLCVHCGAITFKPSVAHNCPSDKAPEYLKQNPIEDYYQPAWMKMNVGGFTLRFEKMN